MGLRLSGGLLRCGSCGKRYTNPLRHVCVTRADSRRRRTRTRLATPKLTWECGRCGKPRGARHTCIVRSDFKARKRRHERQAATAVRRRKREAARSRERERRQLVRQRQAERRRRAAAERRTRDRARKAAAPRISPRPRNGNSHDPAACSDPDCQRYGCMQFREGYSAGNASGYAAGRADGAAEAGGSDGGGDSGA